MRIKICGITQPDQGQAIAQLGATALGFICVPQSPRYVTPDQIQGVITQLSISVDRIGVFANASLSQIEQVVQQTELTGVQLHGDESPQLCSEIKQRFNHLELIKAFRVKNLEALAQITAYFDRVDTLLLDAYHPQLLGGTGHTLNWDNLAHFNPPLPWFLAGGLTPDNIQEALTRLHPTGIDLSSGVERSPGDKDLTKVAQLLTQLQQFSSKKFP
ncbi:Phosphoribosylanthranilate isomerase [Rippkaea orientalis PCC 8801]|uniref:N-(5'-phosphoribosyl)anthranilate isomerase n=1 Tax=Rippkaea orientalis (strain PCC 8801 / RF-1) TaxID=41431 RepID=TRPF_RIPO1|nr:phosphoribosylanthranilate isomerase [Rippkaea orientalis]B7JUH3.1 RecName: Full=N-(5'-phosphoribosyl)anthranilate isomerase; Short=PRAI [Rippkaea orientalis PCC 8801]ACK64553.1 Phosphoribosylanthranilate isomerase [Rippkaea orientalis PCC 8801]